MTDWILLLILWLLCGLVCGWLADKKGLNVTEHVILGVLLGFIGLLMTAMQRNRNAPKRNARRRPPAGWYPTGDGQMRWWTGWEWSRHQKPDESQLPQ